MPGTSVMRVERVQECSQHESNLPTLSLTKLTFFHGGFVLISCSVFNK